MGGGRSSARRRLAVAAVGVAMLGSACATSASSPAPGPVAAEPSGASPGPTAAPSPPPPRFELDVRLGLVRGFPVGPRVRARWLNGPAEAVRETMTSLYRVGFVDPAEWRDGRFPTLFGLFDGDARRQARRDLGDLTLGPAARRLTAVRPGRARLDVRFVVPRNGRPLAAHASMTFRGAGIAGGGELPIEHGGDFLLHRVDGEWKVVAYDVRGRVPTLRDVRRASRAAFAPGPPGVMFLLAIGSDARPGTPPHRGLADSLHIIGVNPRDGVASVVGIPRDSFVPIPGVGTRKINESLFYGGPELTVRTVERLTGIEIDAYLLTAFADFKRLVTEVGGVKVRIPYAMSDVNSQAYFRPGWVRLNGKRALAFSRNRYDAPGGDFGRSLNQGRLIVAALQELRRDLRRDPVTLLRWIVVGARYLRTDLSLGEMIRLAIAAPAIDPARVRNVVVSGSGAMIGGQSVVRLGSGAAATFRDLARDGRLGGR